MNIADSSSWIEYFDDGSLASNFAPIIEDFKSLVVPSIVIYEVHKWLLLKFKEAAALRARSMMVRSKVILLDPLLAVDASRLSIRHKLPMADAIIYATGLANNAIIWTTDAHFKDLPNVRYFDKRNPQ